MWGLVKEQNLIAFRAKLVRNGFIALVRESMYGTFKCNISILKMQNPGKGKARQMTCCNELTNELAVMRRVRSGWNAFNNLSSMPCGNRYTGK